MLHVSVLPTKATTHSLHFANDLAAVPCRAMPCQLISVSMEVAKHYSLLSTL